MLERPTVLIVEDDDSTQDFITLALLEEGYEPVVAPDGVTALELIPIVQPALILLDLHMPQLDGVGFLHRYRQLPGPQAKVLVLTAARDAKAAASPLHVDGVVAKPFALESLLGTMRTLLA